MSNLQWESNPKNYAQKGREGFVAWFYLTSSMLYRLVPR